VRFGRADEHASVDVVHPPLVLELPASARRPAMIVRVHGATEVVDPAMTTSLMLVARDKPSEKDWLRCYVSAMFLAATGRAKSDTHEGLVVPAATAERAASTRTFEIDHARANAWFVDVVSDLLDGVHGHLLPFEAMCDWRALRAENKPARIASIVRALRDGAHRSFSSQYGPVRDLSPFEAPSDEEVEAIVARRFVGFFPKVGEPPAERPKARGKRSSHA
jgi:hypothetical protein